MIFKLKGNEGEIELIPVEMVSADNEPPFIPVGYHEESRKAEKNPDNRYYIISTTGADRVSEEEISQYSSNSLYRIILNDNEIECMILYDY